ncbi:MAG: response regulator transcription factor [Tenericutes bacterium]|nr:response regulator transcription factor [Mycoplasmatota bacterium]
MLKILVVEDDLHIKNIIAKNLEKHGYEVFQSENGKDALVIFENNHIDLIITDIMMPYVDGNALVKTVRYINSDIPIIMLTALDSYYDKEKGFSSGADDYMVKPVNMKEMVLRIKALLRRYKIVSESILDFGDIHLDYKSKSCSVASKEIVLTIKEFSLLYKLLASRNQIFTREQLMNEIWGFDSESYERTVDTHIKRLREKVITESFEIITVRGLGYKAVIK